VNQGRVDLDLSRRLHILRTEKGVTFLTFTHPARHPAERCGGCPMPRKGEPMNTRNVAVIAGASLDIGAGLVTAYRKLGYAIVANSRTITPSDDPIWCWPLPATSQPWASARASSSWAWRRSAASTR
jgi:hypothetical protein